jgi:hypothetical protein
MKDEARDALKAALRTFIKAYLTFNPAVTDADKESMGLPFMIAPAPQHRRPQPFHRLTPAHFYHPAMLRIALSGGKNVVYSPERYAP